jgi:hypothetical protein
LAQFSKDALENILHGYIEERHKNYIRLRWFLRRLTQIAHPGALPFCLKNLESLTPALADVCHYVLAASANAAQDVLSIGETLITGLKDDLIQTNEYFQISLLSLFSRNGAFNHFPFLTARYEQSSPNIRREIILASSWSARLDSRAKRIRTGYERVGSECIFNLGAIVATRGKALFRK